MTSRYPSLPDEQLAAGNWAEQSRTTDTVFRMPGTAVIGKTVLYDDAILREALDNADVEHPRSSDGEPADTQLVHDSTAERFWRFFFATALFFRPPLVPLVGPASVRPTVVNEARKSFVTDLETRGFERVERGHRERMRTETGDRARLTKITAQFPLDGRDAGSLDIEGWLAVWVYRGSFRIAGGAYPTSGLTSLLTDIPDTERPVTDAGQFRDELLDLMRAVQ